MKKFMKELESLKEKQAGGGMWTTYMWNTIQSKDLLKMCFPIKAVRTLEKNSQINFFRTLEIN